MSDNDLYDIHRRHHEEQNKYVYFLLAVSASAIAFSVQKTEGAILSYSMIPLGVAVLSWVISFYSGCERLVWLQAALRANFGLLQNMRGADPEQSSDPIVRAAEIAGVRDALESNIDKAAFHAKLQFRALIAGALFFIVWHILEMWLRTNAT